MAHLVPSNVAKTTTNVHTLIKEVERYHSRSKSRSSSNNIQKKTNRIESVEGAYLDSSDILKKTK